MTLGESKKVVTEQANIFLDEPFPTPFSLNTWKFKLATAIQQRAGKVGQAVLDWIYVVEDDSASNDHSRFSCAGFAL